MNKRHVVCIGAQRTSTTRLYECLKTHPDIIAKMPLEKRINASKKESILKEIEQKLLDSQSENYKRNIDYFGEQISSWKYYDYFRFN